MAIKKKAAKKTKPAKKARPVKKSKPASKKNVKPKASAAKPALGSVIWMGLASNNDKQVAKFYSNVLRLTSEEVSMGPEKMIMLSTSQGQLAHIDKALPDEKPRWIAYFYTDNVDATAKAVTANGGKVIMPPADIPPGRIAFFLDSDGAEFAVFKPR